MLGVEPTGFILKTLSDPLAMAFGARVRYELGPWLQQAGAEWSMALVRPGSPGQGMGGYQYGPAWNRECGWMG